MSQEIIETPVFIDKFHNVVDPSKKQHYNPQLKKKDEDWMTFKVCLNFDEWKSEFKNRYSNCEPFNVSSYFQDDLIQEDLEELLNNHSEPSNIVLVFDELQFFLRNTSLFDLLLKYKFKIGSLQEPYLAEEYMKQVSYLVNSYLPQHIASLKKSDTADAFALKVGEKINEFHQQGKLTLKEKAQALEDANVTTSRGAKTWDLSSVRKVFLRWQELTGNKVDIAGTYTNKSEEFIKNMIPIFEGLEKDGFTTTRAKAEELNRREITTYRGKLDWKPGSIHNLSKKIEQLKAADKKKFDQLK